MNVSGSAELTAVARNLWGEPLGGTESGSETFGDLAFTTLDELPVVLQVRSLADSPQVISLSGSATNSTRRTIGDDGRTIDETRRSPATWIMLATWTSTTST